MGGSASTHPDRYIADGSCDGDNSDRSYDKRDFNDWAHDEVDTIRLINFKKFIASGEFPRFPVDSHLTFEMRRQDALNSFVIFISHAWLRGHPDAEGYVAPHPHPDNSIHEKYRLCVEGIEKLHKSEASTFKDIWLWLDYGCLNQNRNPTETFTFLPDIVYLSDCLFTPIVDHEGDWIYEKTSYGPIVDYKAAQFQSGTFGYLNRGWCRLEMFLASNTPLKNTSQRDNVYGRMKLAILDGRRPHFIYGSKESVEKSAPIEMSPLDNLYFDKYNPLRGYLTRSEDEAVIQSLIQHYVIPLMHRVKPGYVGARNLLMQKHGHGRCTETNGEVYEGQWAESKKHGRGKMHFVNGDVYTGEWVQNVIQGSGRMVYRNGDVYEGDWVNFERHGMGKCIFSDKTTYEGEWNEGVIEGHGVYSYTDSSVYEGDFVQGIKEGIGTLTFANKDIYSGEWNGGYMHGKGVYQHYNGGYYDGEWNLDKKNGHGTYTYPNGSVYVGGWVDGKKHGEGVLTDKKGSRYSGEWKKGMWKG